MRLRQRLTLNFVLVALVSLVLASLIGALMVRRSQVERAQSSVRLLAQLIVSRSALLAEREDAPLRQRGRQLQEMASTQGARLLLIDSDQEIVSDGGRTLEGERFARALPVRDAERDSGVFRVTIAGDPYFVTPLSRPSEIARDLTMVMAVPEEVLLEPWVPLLLRIMVLGGAAVLLAAIVGWQVAPKLSTPLESLTQAANRMAEGEYSARVSTQSDVTELQTLARAFNTMADEVERARQAQRDFLANVSHDLRTPLTSIQGFSQALMDGTVPEEQSARVAGIIHAEAARLTRLVQDLLDLARIEAGRFSMAQQDINLKEVLEQCSERFSLQAETMGVEFKTSIPRRALPVMGDPDRIEQVLTNLIDNALTHAQEGGKHVRLSGKLGGIRNRAAATNGAAKANGNGNGNGHAGANATKETKEERIGRWWVEIRVEDDGPGISEEKRALVFERFNRAGKENNAGLGLGLAIAREIVEAHGGDISIADDRPAGTEFVVRLPMKMK